MIAVLSDVHANLEALTAVYEDLRKREVKRIFFLGDIVGYGPDPAAVLEFTQYFEFCLLGNHDEAALLGPTTNFSEVAQRTTWWTRKQICPEELSNAFLRPAEYQKRKKWWGFLQALKPVHILGETMFVHDSPASPGTWHYVLSHQEAKAAFAAQPDMKAFFCGHSHLPGVWTETGFMHAEPGRKFDFRKRVLVNVGSVGQPRDRDPRASYVLLEPDGFRFFRVPYPYQITQEKIRRIPELDGRLADRLASGT
jgi:predicted phosphodiesterase